MSIAYSDLRELPRQAVIALYAANHWSSAKKPDQLLAALNNSDAVLTAWDGEMLVGLGNTLSDGHLVVYYPHLLVHPDYHGRGIGKGIVDRLKARYPDLHQHILISDGKTIDFYRKCGFAVAGATQSMWIYSGDDH